MFNGFSWQTRTLEVRADRLPPDLDLSNPLNQVYPQSTYVPPSQFGSPALSGSFTGTLDPRLEISMRSPVPGGLTNMNAMSQSLQTSSAQGNSTHPLGRNLFVGNVSLKVFISYTSSKSKPQLPFHCQWQDLKDLFRTAGQIVRADIALGPDGRSRGFGTVLFANDNDAETAVRMFNGYAFPRFKPAPNTN